MAGDETGGSGGAPVAGSAGSGLGGTPGTAGQAATGGSVGGSAGSVGTGAAPTTGGTLAGTGGRGGAGTSGAGAAGTGTAGTGTAGTGTAGTGTAGTGTAGTATGGAQAGGSGGSGGQVTGTCTASKSAGKSVSGSGPHDVVIETNSDNGIKCGTIYRPKDLGGAEKFPILVWGEGGCSQNGLSNQAAMGEIASWGYFIVADGTPGGTDACEGRQNGRAFLDYITWAMAENDKPCSAYYQSLQTTKIAADGFSCGGLMAENVSGDPRFTAIGITSSGLMGSNSALYDRMHAPFKIMNGGPSDIAYPNGLNDYAAISSRGIPIVQLKGDEGATGKGFLHGPTCEFCTNSGWEYMSANIQ